MSGLQTTVAERANRSEWTEGSWDIHVHAAPSIFDRWGSAWDLAEVCREAGMSGFVLKFHHGSSVEIACALQAIYPSLSVFGGVALNHFVGGLNPLAVETCLKLGGKIVWLPTVHAVNHGKCCGPLGGFGFQSSKVASLPPPGIRIIDENGRLTDAMKQIVEMMSGEAAVLATGHTSPLEIYELIRYIERNCLRVKVLVNHVSFKAPALDLQQLKELTRAWVWFETVQLCISPLVACASVEEIASSILSAPESNWILASDSGQKENLKSPHALSDFASKLHGCGVSRAQLRAMLKMQPERLLGLKE